MSPEQPALYAGIVVAVAALTWLARRYALSRRLMDEPGARRSHKAATPRGGGVSIVLAMLPLLAWAGLAGDAAARPLLLCAVPGLILVAGIGWWDDHRPLPARWRLLVHALAAALLAGGAFAAGGSWALALAVFGTALVLVNVWNFMDGIDGLAASQAAIVAVACAWLAAGGPGRWLGIALALACLGFLPFNFPRARIFLGDVGSGALGYLLATLGGLLWLQAGAGEWWRAALLCSLPASAFLVDASLTLARRMLRGEAWWRPHVQHAYQVAARRAGHRTVTLAYAGWSLTGGILAVSLGGTDPAFGFMMTASVAWQAAGGLLWIAVQEMDRRMTPNGPVR